MYVNFQSGLNAKVNKPHSQAEIGPKLEIDIADMLNQVSTHRPCEKSRVI